MGILSRFTDNTIYKNTNINRYFSQLTLQGVSLFQDTKTTLSDLNATVGNLVTPGVESAKQNACLVSVDSSGRYTIAAGTAYMPNGATVTVDEDLCEITPIVDETCYVGFKLEDNQISPMVSVTQPTENYVLLATIDENGSITDNRTFSEAKFAMPLINSYLHLNYKVLYSGDTVHVDKVKLWNGYQYIICVDRFIEITEDTPCDITYRYDSYHFELNNEFLDIYLKKTASDPTYFDLYVL